MKTALYVATLRSAGTQCIFTTLKNNGCHFQFQRFCWDPEWARYNFKTTLDAGHPVSTQYKGKDQRH